MKSKLLYLSPRGNSVSLLALELDSLMAVGAKDISAQSHNPQPPPAIRSRQREPEDPGHQQPQQSTEPRKPTAGTTTHPPRRPQRKPPDRAPIIIGQRTPVNQGQRPTDPARPLPPRPGPCTGPGPQEPERPQPPRQRPHPIPERAKRPRQPHSGPAPAPAPLAKCPGSQDVPTGG